MSSDAPSLREPGVAVVLHCSQGQVEVRVGDEFDAPNWFQGGGDRWQIEGFTGERIYSPSGFGGTPIVRCRPVHGMPAGWAEYANEDGSVDWCGDSVGAALMSNRKDGSTPQNPPPQGKDHEP